MAFLYHSSDDSELKTRLWADQAGKYAEPQKNFEIPKIFSASPVTFHKKYSFLGCVSNLYASLREHERLQGKIELDDIARRYAGC